MRTHDQEDHWVRIRGYKPLTGLLFLDDFIGDGLSVAEHSLADADAALGRVELTAVHGVILYLADEADRCIPDIGSDGRIIFVNAAFSIGIPGLHNVFNE